MGDQEPNENAWFTYSTLVPKAKRRGQSRAPPPPRVLVTDELDYKKSYRFRVAAVDALGTGPWTSTQTIHLRTLAQNEVVRALGDPVPNAPASDAADGTHHPT